MAPKKETEVVTEAPRSEELVINNSARIAAGQSLEVTPLPEVIGQPTAQEFVLEVPVIGPNVKLPLGLKTIEELAREWDSEIMEVEKTIQAFRDRHPEEPIFSCKFRDTEEALYCLSPEQVNLVQQENELRANSPPGAKTAMELAELWDVSGHLIRKITTAFRKNHPEEVFIKDKIRLGMGTQKAWVYTPEQIELMKAEHRINEQYPDGTKSIREVAEELSVNIATFRGMVKKFGKNHPEQKIQMYRNKEGYHIRLTSEQIAIVIAENQLNVHPPEGSKTVQELAEKWEIKLPSVRNRVELFFKKYPDEERKRFKIIGTPKLATHLLPHQVAIIEEDIGVGIEIPEGYKCAKDLEEAWGIHQTKVSQILRNYRAQNPDECFLEGRTDNLGLKVLYYSPEQLVQIETKYNIGFPPPEGYLTLQEVSDLLGVSLTSVYSRVKTIKKENPEHQFTKYRKPGMAKKIYFLSPEQVAIIDTRLSSGLERKETILLESSLVDYLAEVSRGETREAKEFIDLVSVCPELVTDILFLHHPEYQKLGLPYAKRVIGDYLGDILPIRGELRLDKLEKGIQFLSDLKFKESLTESIKIDCLKYYNQQRREGLVDNDRLTLDEYFEDLRNKTASFGAPEWLQVLNEVEEYYKALFDAIQIPDNVVEELESGRLFPDINQRINILELMGKQKMLIADDMGVGKSASAILAKESLGVKQALVVAPSNVIDVWQNYLSDYKNDDGSTKGYFKEGQAPRVLTIENGLNSLSDLDLSEFDYVLISQEKLEAEGYTTFLEQLDYDMLIVDEVHKLKNIQSGKRANSLVKLAEKIDGEDKYLALLSGTPVPNKVGDIAMILKLLYPEKFEGVANKELTSQILNGDILDLRSLLVPRMQMKSLAETVEMPKLVEKLHAVQMSEQERKFYEVILEQDDLTASQKLQILRQIVLNPEAFEVTPTFDSSKLAAVGDELRSTFTTKDKVVMFFNGYMDGVIRGDTTIFEGLKLPEGVEVHIIDGKVSKKRRLEIQQMLQEESGKKILLAVSGQTADVGVDFSGAEEVYRYNEPWSEYDNQQQLGRVYRPGLKGDLVCHTFYVEDTIEEGIHRYIDYKYRAIEKLLRGIPISELEQEMLKQAERQNTPNLEVNSGLAESYLSTSAKMLKIFNYVNEIGQEGFVKFGERYWTEYAKYYSEIGSRSYQANTARLSGAVIDGLAKAKGQPADYVRVLDVASGPEMLKRHMPEEYQDQVVSVDINPHHFETVDEKRRVGSFLNLPVADSTMDYVNLALALHYTERPQKDQYERIRVFQELNRVLVNGGAAVINLAHNHGLKNTELFAEAAKHLGFEVVEDLSGEVGSGNNFRSQMLVLQKVSSCTQDTAQLVQSMGPALLQGFKFLRTNTKLRDSRKISTLFSLSNGKVLKAQLNKADQAVFDEEQSVLALMTKLRRTYQSIKAIPSDVISQSGLSRAKTDKKREAYVLFKSLETGNGAVIIR